MKKTLSALILYIASSVLLTAAPDTTFFDKAWKPTLREKAFYYRPHPVKEGKGYRFLDYYKSGKVQMTGISLQEEDLQLDGKVKWFYESGELQQEAVYQQGKIEGNFVVYKKDGSKLSEGFYQEGMPFNGEFTSIYEGYSFKEKFKEGKPLEKFVYSNDPKNLVHADIFYEKGILSYIDYYDNTGMKIAVSHYNSEQELENGQEVYLNFNPLSINSITEVNHGVRLSPTRYYYTSGLLRSEIFTEDGNITQSKVYATDGKILAMLTYQDDLPYDGVNYTFHEFDEDARVGDIPKQIQTFVHGKLNGSSRLFYKSGTLKYEINYLEDVKTGSFHSYKPDGSFDFEGLYRDGSPYSGTFQDDDQENKISTYQNGELISYKVFYSSGKLQSFMEGEKITYYNESGKIMGTMVSKDESPYEGLEITFNNDLISDIAEYKQGVEISHQTYNEQGQKTEDEKYDENGSVTAAQAFYENGKLKSITQYKGYDPDIIQYYGKDGKLMGEFHHSPVLDGTEIIFSDDRISKIVLYKNDQEIGGKLFKEDGSLLYDVNPEGQSVFYDDQGKLLSTVSYHNGKPLDGTVFVYDEYSHKIRERKTYKSGMLDGIYLTYDLDNFPDTLVLKSREQYKKDVRDGLQENFKGEYLLWSISYKNNIPEGKAVFYNQEGEKLSEATYVNGYPVQGTVYEYSDGFISIASTYEAGELQNKKYFVDGETLSKTELYSHNQMIEVQTVDPQGNHCNLKYEDNIPQEGKIYEDVVLKSYSKGRKISETTFTEENERKKEIVFDSESKYKELIYYPQGNLRSEIKYSDNLRNGIANFYGENGKLISQGTFKEGIPVQGIFYFPDEQQPDEVLKLEIKPGTLSANFLKQSRVTFTLTASYTGDTQDEEARNVFINNFLEMILIHDINYHVKDPIY